VVSVALLLIALLLAALVALFAGTQRPLPAPFGPARNGVVAYESGGDIYTADPVTGEGTAIVTGPERDVGPRFSLDGSRIVFERKLDAARSQLYVVGADGGSITLITPEPIALAPGASGRAWERYKVSPDGQTVLFSMLGAGGSVIGITEADGGGVRQLDVGMSAIEPTFRPPDGAEILFVGSGAVEAGLFAVDPATGTVREILIVAPGMGLAGASWSPDGSRIAYWMWDTSIMGMSAKSHVVASDGTGDRELPSPPGSIWNAHAIWSNDGTRLFVAHGFTNGNDDVRGWVTPADGTSAGVEVAPAGTVETECCAAWLWSPDDSVILGRSAPLRGEPLPQLVIDVAGKKAAPAPWTSSSDPTWQRLAP
jgi:Tol biopolymer transport system component